MGKELSLEDISIIFKIFFDPKYSFYVLGAGVSANISPTINQICKDIIFSYSFEIPCGNIKKNKRLYPRLFSIIKYWVFMAQDPPAIDGMIVQSIMRSDPEVEKKFKHQYEVFSICASKPSVIFNFNEDGLAEKYCGIQHRVITAHGLYDPTIINSPFGDKCGQNALYEGCKLPEPFYTALLPTIPEPTRITKTDNYIAAENYFRSAKYLVIIGYSFGDLSDDLETYNFLINLLIKYPKPVIVISLSNAEKIAGGMQANIPSC